MGAMAVTRLIVGVALASAINVALASQMLAGMRVSAREEIMAHMTAEKAARLVMGMNSSFKQSELTSLIQEHFGHALTNDKRTHLRNAKQHHRQRHVRQDPSTTAQPTGYAQVDLARTLLNGMIKETETKLELKEIECLNFNHSTLKTLEDVREDIATFNAAAAQSRGMVLKAQGAIGTIEIQVPKLKDELADVKEECMTQEQALKNELAIVERDLETLEVIMKKTDCEDPTVANQPEEETAVLFLQKKSQKKTPKAAQTVNLMQCGGCDSYSRVTMLQAPAIQHLISTLKTPDAHDFVQEELGGSFHRAKKVKKIALTEEQSRHHRILAKTLARRRQDPEEEEAETSERGSSPSPAREGGVNVHAIPEETTPSDCRPTDKCTLAHADCTRLRDRFLLIQSGILEKQAELKEDLEKLQDKCMFEIRSYDAQIAALEENLRKEQTNLAMSTEDQVEAEEGSHLKGTQHSALSGDYTGTMKECCEAQNNYKSESCALEKIRGELMKMEGQDAFITDCKLTAWEYEACSVTCGGGTKKATRSVMVHPVRGAACLPLEMTEACGTDACPVDCKLGDWTGYSECTAKCGGGVKSRNRPILVNPEHGGDPCGPSEQTEACGVEACDQECVLGEWTEWGPCSAECGGGSQERSRGVETESVGAGHCPEADDPMRLDFTRCAPHPCEERLPRGREILKCDSKIDLILLVDGSGSLGEDGWNASKVLTETIVNAMETGPEGVQMAVELFSGPATYGQLYGCIGGWGGIDIVTDCQIRWVSHFTYDKEALDKEVQAMEWPASSTLTSMALSEAETMIMHGRADAQTVVVVLTDGKPMSVRKTVKAARSIQKKAKLIVVPVGKGISEKVVRRMVTPPADDHIVKIDSFEQMTQPETINKIIATSCKHVE